TELYDECVKVPTGLTGSVLLAAGRTVQCRRQRKSRDSFVAGRGAAFDLCGGGRVMPSSNTV
ncbi:hypothetical protein NQZ68_019927, partial [Dissostichus eleginoides]